MKTAYKTRIHIEGRSIEDIFRLPCVCGVRKNVFGAAVYDLFGFVMADGSPTTAGGGDWLCLGYDDKWYVVPEKETENLDK